MVSPDGLLWIIEDSGNKNRIYGVDQQGILEREIKIKKAKNKDWEDFTKDTEGNLYIGDFGNNNNKRKDLRIYKVQNPENTLDDELVATKIEFYFPEQRKFPPSKKRLWYDVEAFFHWQGHFYLFTRNRASSFDGRSLVYKVPARAPLKRGKHKKHVAKLLGTITTCDKPQSCSITSAAISPDTSKVVLLSQDRLWLIPGVQTEEDLINTPLQEMPFDHFSQKEAVCFKDCNTLFITDEERKGGGRNLYLFDLNALSR